MDNLERTLSLKVHFFNDTDERQQQKYTPTSLDKILKKEKENRFNPPTVNCIKTYSEAIKDEIQHCQQKSMKDNLSKRERAALKRLQLRNDIIIKKADKGGATVIMDKSDYYNEAMRQLNNTDNYIRETQDNTNKNEKIIESKLTDLIESKDITKKTAEKLKPKKSRTPHFYLLPKIHKPNNPGRPVVSSSSSHTEKISAFVDDQIKPIVQKLSSKIQDTNDFLEKIKKLGKISKNSTLVTMDVSSLYTNIPHNEGLGALENALKSTPLNSNITIKAIITMMHLILTLNNFIFNNEFFLQIKGTAMGTRAAPNYASIFMGAFERKHIYNSKYYQHIWFYCRFIDDIFIIWTGSEKELKEFFEYINKVHKTIKFTTEHSRYSINFLDTIVTINEDGTLTTDVFQKITDTHNYLHRTSAHPEHNKRSIPYSQFLRIKRICSDNNQLKKRIKQYIEYFVNSGYSRKELTRTAEKILNETLNEEKKENHNKKDNGFIPAVTTYNEAIPNINKVFEKHWNITQTNAKCRRSLKLTPKAVYRRNKNLKDIFVKAKFQNDSNVTTNNEKDFKVTKCNAKRCSWCKNIVETETFSSKTNNKVFNIRHNMTCVSDWVIYLAECKSCSKQYTGKSETQLNIRFNNNRNHLNLGLTNCKLVQHYYQSKTCNFERDLLIIPIERLQIAKIKTLPKKERNKSYLIEKNSGKIN